MKKFTSLAILGGATFALAACGRSENASVDATADTVELPAAEALESVPDDAVEDPAANAALEEETGEDATAAVTQEDAETAADNAVAVADEAIAAAEAAEAAGAGLQDVIETAEDVVENVSD